jgi:hypothetical protein
VGDGVGTLITRFILYSDWTSWSRDWNVDFEWSFLHSFSWLATDPCRLLTSSVNGNTGVRTRPLSGFQSNTSPNWFPGSSRVRGFYVYTSRAFRKAPMKFSTHVLIATGLCHSELNGIKSSESVWKMDLSVRLKLGLSVSPCHNVLVNVQHRYVSLHNVCCNLFNLKFLLTRSGTFNGTVLYILLYIVHKVGFWVSKRVVNYRKWELIKVVLVCFWRNVLLWDIASFTMFVDHTRLTTVGITPLYDWSARRIALYLTLTIDERPCPRLESPTLTAG